MSACVVSIVNIKGGVGKSTTANCLAHGLAEEQNMRILVIDLDPQASVSNMLCGEQRWNSLKNAEYTLEHYFQQFTHGSEPRRIEEFIAENVGDLGNDPCIDLIPSSPELRNMERDVLEKFALHGLDRSNLQRRLSGIITAAINSLAEHYDVLLFDFPPGISLLSEQVMPESDILLVPTIPDYVSRLGTEAVFRRVQHLGAGGGKKQIHSFANKYDDSIATHHRELEIIQSRLSSLRSVLPYHKDIARAGQWCQSKRSLSEKYAGANNVIRRFIAEFHDIIENSAS